MVDFTLQRKKGVNVVRNIESDENSLKKNSMFIHEAFQCNEKSNKYIENIINKNKVKKYKFLLKAYLWKIKQIEINPLIKRIYEEYYDRKTS